MRERAGMNRVKRYGLVRELALRWKLEDAETTTQRWKVVEALRKGDGNRWPPVNSGLMRKVWVSAWKLADK